MSDHSKFWLLFWLIVFSAVTITSISATVGAVMTHDCYVRIEK